MKRLTQIFQALLGVVASILTAIVAAGRLAWYIIRNWWKKCSKWVRRAIAVLLVLIPVGFMTLVAYAYYEGKHGRSYWDEKEISKNVKAHYFRDGKYRVYNRHLGKYTTSKLSWVSTASGDDLLAVYALPGKRGYINVQNGEIVIDAESNDYRKAWVFSNGLAAVMRDDKIGFINVQNEVVIPFQFDYSDEFRRWDFGYVFHNGYCVMTNADGDMGLIDKSGKWVIEPLFDEIWAPHDTGYRIFVDDGGYGVLDSKCNVVYPAEYGYIDILPNGFVLTKGGKRWQVDFEGSVVHPFLYDGTYYLNYPIDYYGDCSEIQYALADYAKYKVMSCYGIMNRITGELITPAIYSDINMLSKDLFEVQTPETFDWFLVDTHGNIISRK